MPDSFTNVPRVTEQRLIMQSAQFEAEDLLSEITFGVEIEFLAPPDSAFKNTCRKYPEYIRTLMSRDHTYHYLASALQQAGLQAAYLFETEESDCEDNQLRKAAPMGSIVKTGVSPDMRIMNPSSYRNTGENPLFKYWVLKLESDIMGFGKYEEWQSTELNTPILRESESNTGFPDLNKALHALLTAHPERVHVNDTCGIHVHVRP